MYSLKVELSLRDAQHVGDVLLAAGAAAIDVAPSPEHEERAVLRVYVPASDRSGIETTLRSLLRKSLSSESSGLSATLVVERVTADWETRWVETLPPVELVPGLVLVPEGVHYERQRGERTMVLEKGLVFGFGEHPTTQMACEWLAGRVKGKRVLDVGSGTGVLSFVAAYCGASFVLGIDIDAPSVCAARRNAMLNHWADVCAFSESPLSEVTGTFDVVVANVDAMTLVRLASDVSAVMGADTVLALTGVLQEQVLGLQQAYASVAVNLCISECRQDWALLQGQKLVG